MANYTGDPSKIVSSSYLFTELQNLYTKIKGLLSKKADVSHNHTANEINPILTSTYSDIYASGNNFANGTFYFGTIMPTDYNVPWKVRYKIHSSVDGQNSYSGVFDVELVGNQSNRITYRIFNTHTSQNCRTLYYHVLYSATSTGISNGYGHLLGVGLRSSNNPTNSSYKRNFVIEILELENCTITMLDTMTLYSEIDGSGSTNYNGYSEYDGANNGLRESGDDNSYDKLLNASIKVYAGANKIFPYTLIMETTDGKYESFVLYSSQSTTKSKNTSGFRLGKILYYGSGTTISSGNPTSTWTLYEANPYVDFRYDSNCGNTLTANKPIYLVGTVENEIFYLADNWYSQSLPTSNDGYVYIYLGEAINTYQLGFSSNHPVYTYKNGYVQEYVGNAQTVNGHTVESDVPADAKFTDTTYTTVTSTKDGLMSYEDKIKFDTMEIGANNYVLPVASDTLGGIKIGYSQSGKTYPVQLNENNQAFVNIPWENTWRGVQNNLTSTSTTDSLSAYQGKILKGLVDGKAPASGSTSIGRLSSKVTLGDGSSAEIVQNSGNYQQKISIHDNATSEDEVFKFQQSSDSGSTFLDLMTIKDNGVVEANRFEGTFSGVLNGTAVVDTAIATKYITSPSFIGEGDESKYYHRLDFGKSGKNTVDFYEYGGVYNFYQNTTGVKADSKLLGKITNEGWVGNVVGTATKAVADENGKNITENYITDLSVKNNALVMTNGAGTSVEVMDLPTVGTSTDLGLSKLYESTGTNTDGSMTQNAITSALKGKSNNNHNHDSSYLKLSGGTVTGAVNLTQGAYISRFNANNSSTNGYMHIANFVITANYVNVPIILNITKRSGYGTLLIKFKNSGDLDPSLETFRYKGEGFNNLKGYMVKSDTSTWDLYIKETENYDYGAILEYGTHMSDKIVATWIGGTHTEDIGEDYIESTIMTVYENVSGNATTATKATNDSAGQQINATYIKGLSVSGKIITYTKGDGTTGTITTQDTNTTYSTGTTSTAGLTKLYTSTGSSTDGTMTRKAITEALATKTNLGHTHTSDEVNAIDIALKGVANGVAELDENGKVPSAQLPSYVDDVLEYDTKSNFPTSGEASKIYVDKTTNLTYRWTGSTYIEISKSLALGETSSTAYRGDRGKIAYTHSQSAHAPTNAEKNVIVGIQKNGADIAVDSTTRKVNIVIPTKVSDLENDSNFQSTVYDIGTPSMAGITKLYAETGTNVDGAMTQSAITTELSSLETALNDGLAEKSNVGHTHSKYDIGNFVIKLTNEDLNSIRDVGYYYAGGGNTTTNKPSGIDAFGMEVIRSADGWYTQKLYASNSHMKEYIRWYQGGSWTVWKDMTVTADHTHSYLPLSGGTVTGSLVLSKNTDLSGTSNNMPALIVGNNVSSNHLELDANEIQAKASGTKIADLYLNVDGGKVIIGNGGLDSYGTVTATTFKGSLNGNADTATVLETARTISTTGGAIGTATSFDGSKDITVPITKLDANYLYGTIHNNAYIATNPEGDGAIIPYINNDLAFLLTRGGSYSVYYTTDTDYTALELTNSGALSWDLKSAFDGSSSYSYGNVTSKSSIVVIDINLPSTQFFNNKLYYDSGSENWRAKSVKFYVYNSSDTESVTYKLAGETSDCNGRFSATCSYNYTLNGTSKTGFNRWRIVLTNFANTTPRIACLGLINYASIGVRQTYMSRGIDDALYRSISVNTDNTYDLGSSSKRWKNVYANTFTGSLNGNAKTATSATTATKATQDSSGQQIDATYIKGLSVNGKVITYTKGDGTTGTITTQDTTYSAVSSSGNGLMTPTLLAKLNSIANGAEVNVNADWNATSGDAMILNKPTIPEVIFETTSLDLSLLV